jgi:hypothetical protein
MKMNVIKGEKGEIKMENCSFFIDQPSSFDSSFSPFSLLLPSTQLYLLNCSFKDMTLDDSQLISLPTPPPPPPEEQTDERGKNEKMEKKENKEERKKNVEDPLYVFYFFCILSFFFSMICCLAH